MIFEAAKLAGVRALVNKGWGGLGDGDDVQVPDNVFMLENTPHDWLFPKVAAVVHHGGAGTTAIGLKCGKPTMIVPFFGDQPFWGAEVAKHQAGALECIPYKKLTVDRLAEGIKQCLTEEAQVNAKRLAEDINAEGDGAANAVASFHRSLPFSGPNSMRCSILEDRVAVWHVRGTSLRLSAVAAEILLQKRKIKRHDLKLLRHCSWNDFDGPGEPITGSVAAITDSVFDIGTGVGMVPLRVAKQIRKQKAHEHKKRQAAIRKAEHRRKKDAARAAEANAELERQNAEKANGDAHPPAESAEPSDSRPSIQREQTASTQLSVVSTEGPDVPLPTAIVTEVRSGLRKSAVALLTMPNDLHLAVAQGFHNAPRLWGDATVRKPTRITGIKSGLIAARREFVYGVYDGFTGVVTQPIGGWRDASASRAIAQSEVADGDRMLEKPAGAGLARKLGGFGTGIAKGLGGLVVKNVSAIITPPAYFGKGVLVWTGKRMEGEGTKKFLRRSHFTVGFVELLDLRNAAAANPAEKEKLQKTLAKVGERWKALYVVDKPEKGQKSKNAPSSSSAAAAAEKKRTRSSSRPRIEPKDRHKSGTMPLRSSKDERDALTPTPTKEARSTDLDGTATKDAIVPVTKADAKNLAVHNDDSRTADGSGVGGKGHLDPLVPPASSARHPDSLQAPHDVRERDDLPSDTTLASPADEERQDDNDDDDAEDHKKDSDDMENPTTTTTTSTVAPTNLQKVATSPHLEKTTSLTRDFANKKLDEEQEKNGASGKKEKKKSLKKKEKEANKMENGIKPQGGFSPRAMMKGTRFGRRAGGEVEVV
jgi:hypothetical protein